MEFRQSLLKGGRIAGNNNIEGLGGSDLGEPKNVHHRKMKVSEIMECARSQAPLETVEAASFASDPLQIETDKSEQRKRGGLRFEQHLVS